MKKIFYLFVLLPLFGLSQGNPVNPYKGIATGTNSYSLTISDSKATNMPNAPIIGETVLMKVTTPNSGASTLKLTIPTGTSYATKNITQNGSVLTGGEIVQNVWNILTYDTLSGGQWQLMGRTIGTYTGSVTTVSVVTANGVSGIVADPTTTPAITLSVTPNVSNATGILPLANGGTNASITAADGAIFYSNATKGALTATNKAYWDYTNGRLGLGKNSGLDAVLTAVSTGTTYASPSPLLLLNSNGDTIVKVYPSGQIRAGNDALSNLNIGINSGKLNTTGSKNTSIGFASLITNLTGTDNTVMGYNSGVQITGSTNTSIGSLSQALSISSTGNTSVGYVSLFGNNTGLFNTAIGVSAGYTNSLGNYNTYLGYHAGYDWAGSNRTFIQAGQRDSAITVDGNNGQFNITNGHIKIVDGSQGSGKVLMSDGNGLGTWTTPSSGTITNIATGTGLTGGPITSTGTISISVVPLANGGTNSTTAASNGSVVYSTASAYGMTAVGTPGQLLQSNGATAPTFVSDIIPNSVATTAVTINKSGVTNPIALDITTQGDYSSTAYSTGALIRSKGAFTSTGIDVSAESINGGVANAGTFSSIASNPLGYNNGPGCFASGAKYNTGLTISGTGGTDAIGITVEASGGSSKNTAINISSGSIDLNGSSGAAGQVLTSAGTGVLPTWTTIGSGTYTPTLTNQTNISSSTPQPCQWERNGSVVTVSGGFLVTETGTGSTILYVSLPIASTFTNFSNLGGSCSSTQDPSPVMNVNGNVDGGGNGIAYIRWAGATRSSQNYTFIFMYRIM